MEPLLIAGLGNPGDEYALTRHNAGLDFINLLCENYSLNLKKENQINGYFAEYETESYKLILVTPSTYMNDSGLCISKCKKFFNLNTNQILIAHDELDLPNAHIKLKESGGHGGHNGLRNIIDHFKGDNSFKRIRIGIGKPSKDKDVISYVLKKAPKNDREEMIDTLKNYLDLGERIMEDGWQKTVMNFHTVKEEKDNES
jgi:PTH1 family peptidyl-tRNA hydrolase|tara:strand:+ start:2738 stop:3337 length:600 start_codon:yes stop_codon:yes gene_type:complete